MVPGREAVGLRGVFCVADLGLKPELSIHPDGLTRQQSLMEPVYLTEIRRLDGESRLRLTWSDGHRADFDYDYVRGYCPCASCQGHGSMRIEFHQPRQPVVPEKIEPVGNYAISIVWSDHHATGIYRFDFLRDICPCPKCGSRNRTG